MIRIAVVQQQDSSAEREIIATLERAGMQAQRFSWQDSKEKLADFHGFILADRFSAEDYLRASAIAALDPIMQEITAQSLLGKPVLGICKGAHILVEAGLVPGLEQNQLGIGLADNKRMQQGKVLGTGFYHGWVHVRLAEGYQWNAFTRYLTPNHILSVPVAHAEGRFIISPVLLAEMERNGLHLFQYCDEHGNIVDEFPVNPNGSIHNIAAIANKTGNVMAVMPHIDGTPHADAIFKSMHEYIANGYVASPTTLHYQPRALPIKQYQKPAATCEWIVDSMSDHAALSLENALLHSGISVTIKQAIHWEIQCDSNTVLEKIKRTGVLFNHHQEKIIEAEKIKNKKQTIFLVRAKDNVVGEQKLEMLRKEFGIEGVQAIAQSILWCVSVPEGESLERIMHSTVLFNPYTHDGYFY